MATHVLGVNFSPPFKVGERKVFRLRFEIQIKDNIKVRVFNRPLVFEAWRIHLDIPIGETSPRVELERVHFPFKLNPRLSIYPEYDPREWRKPIPRAWWNVRCSETFTDCLHNVLYQYRDYIFEGELVANMFDHIEIGRPLPPDWEAWAFQVKEDKDEIVYLVHDPVVELWTDHPDYIPPRPPLRGTVEKLSNVLYSGYQSCRLLGSWKAELENRLTGLYVILKPRE